MNGGWDKYKIPEYTEQNNNPMLTNEQKRIYNQNKPMPQNENKNQILNLQLYQPPKPKPQGGVVPNPSVFYPNFVPNPFDPIGYGQYLNQTRNNQAPIYKEYNININGISGSHIKTAMIYEDILPSKSIATSFATVGERINMYESIRSMLFANGDGYDIPVDTSAYNILSHIKLMDINPYNASKYSNNPYKGLPYGFILYRSCYPIRHDPRNSTAQCSRNSTGANVRVYRLTEGCHLVNKHDGGDITKYDIWRDIAFYNYIKEDILKKKVCPNFALMYGYNVSLESRIDYDNIILKAKNNGNNNNKLQPNKTVSLTNDLDKFDMKPSIKITRDPQTGMIRREIVEPKRNPLMMKLAEAKHLNSYKGKSLVCLTEAPNYSIIGWAKKEYRTDGNIKRMINPGYHHASVWKSVIFQLLAALYTMQLKQIIINDFSLERNVFIKDIDTGGRVTNYWKYIIDGIEYYIPNYGYLLLIDSNYRDFDKQYNEDETEIKETDRKVTGGFITGCKLSREECNDKVFAMLDKALDRNIFGQEFLNDNGAKPPDEILQLLTSIKNEVLAKNTNNISFYIRKYMSNYMHNRIGTPLQTLETPHIKTGGVREFRKGQIVVMNDTSGINRFVLYVTNNDEHIARIITRDSIDPNNYNIIENDVHITSLNEYSVMEPIKQKFDMNLSNLNEESLLEVYVIA